jgi:hypothetical protein
MIAGAQCCHHDRGMTTRPRPAIRFHALSNEIYDRHLVIPILRASQVPVVEGVRPMKD